MSVSPAPFFEDVAGGPAGGQAHWVKASDGVRLRVGHWRPEGDARGTVMMFPGRTEYIEKYGDAAREFTERGFAMLAVDWRGQGLADRLLEDRRLGHVIKFTDYQLDVEAVTQLAVKLDLPKPWFIIGHSMGGGIGLRAAMDGLPIQACAFTGPMWGIFFTPVMKPLSWLTTNVAPVFGMGHRNPATTTLDPYVIAQEFEGNSLTRDPDMYQMMRKQITAHPELSLGAPTNIWLREAIEECRILAERPSPDMPCITFLGSHEQIVDRKAVRNRMARWPRGELVEIPNGEHEVLMEAPDVRGPAYQRMADLFAGSPPLQQSA